MWRLNPNVVTTTTGNPVSWPKMTAANTGSIVAEAGTLTVAEATFGPIVSTPVKYAGFSKLSSEIVQDSAVDITGFIARHLGYSIANLYGPHFATGTVTGQPQGYITGGTVTVSAAGTCSPDSAIRLQHSVNQRYREPARFATNSGVLSHWRRLRADAGGTTGPWLLHPPSAPVMPEYLYGSPVVEDNNIAAHGSAVKSVAFGDFADCYLIHDAGMRLESSTERFFESDQIAYRALWRLDGRVLDQNGMSTIYQATAN